QHMWATTCARPSSQLSPAELTACDEIDAQLRFYDPAKAAGVTWASEPNTLKNSATVSALIQSSCSGMRLHMQSHLPTPRVPALIMYGDFDPIPRASFEYLHQQIPGSQLVQIPHSGHFSFIEQPEAFIAAVRTFLLN